MDIQEAERLLVGRPVVVFAQGAAVEIQRMRSACLREEIVAAVGPCPGSG